MIKQAVIFCGGYGTRLFPITKKIPKPMVNINKKPFLFYLLEQCKANGINEVVLLCGYKFEIIKEFFGNGEKVGVNIKYHFNSPDVQTYKRIYDAKHLLKKKFLLLYSDNYCSLNLHDMQSQFNKLKADFLITVCKKKNGNIFLNKKRNILSSYHHKKKKNSNFVEIGYMIINKSVIINSYKNKNETFGNLIKQKSRLNKVHFYLNDTEYLSISDTKRLKITKNYFNKKIVLVDRDGVLNFKCRYHHYVRNLKELKINYKFIYQFKKALINKKLICITNQAGISTGDLTIINLELINKKIKKIYSQNNILIAEFLVSQSHFLSNDFYRKPNHGLFLLASKKFKFILDRVCYIGDDIRDIEASYRAKTKCLYLGKKKINNKLKNRYKFTIVNKVL